MSASSLQCPLCADDVSAPDQLIAPAPGGCAHGLCASCWARFLSTKFEAKGGFTSCYDGKLMCPGGAPHCKTVVSLAFARRHCDAKTGAFVDAALATVPKGERATLPPEQLTLDDFNYYYNADGMLRHKLTQGKFIFVNQAHYELLGDVITLHIQRVLRAQYGLNELFLPFVKGEPDLFATLARDAPTTSASAKPNAAAVAAAAAVPVPVTAAPTAIAATTTPAPAAAAAGAGAGATPAAAGAAAAAAASSSTDAKAATATAIPGAPVGTPNRPHANIFASPDALYADTLLVLIQGSGAVRPGMWARACCINDSLAIGTIFPYLDAAMSVPPVPAAVGGGDAKAGAGSGGGGSTRQWGVVVLNPNQNRVRKSAAEVSAWKQERAAQRAAHKQATGKELPPDDESSWNYQLASQWTVVPGNTNGREHALYVWDHVLRHAKARHVLVVAHSAGGHATMALLQERTAEVVTRVRAVAFTDSVHSVPANASARVRSFMRAHCINYVQSDAPLDTPCDDERQEADDGCPCVSAGHPKHEFTSGTALPSVFKFLDKHLAQAKADTK